MEGILSHLRIFSLCLVTLLLTNCDELWFDDGHSLDPYSILIIKFDNYSYKDKILAYLRDDRYATGKEEPTMTMRYNKCIENPENVSTLEWNFDFAESPRTPYWELADGWLLIDWRWFHYPYNRSSSVIIDREWNDFLNGTWKWSRDEIIDYDPIVGWINVPINRITNSLNKTYSSTTYMLVESTSFLEQDLEINGQHVCLCEIPNLMDSIWSELQTDLSYIITHKGIKTLYN